MPLKLFFSRHHIEAFTPTLERLIDESDAIVLEQGIQTADIDVYEDLLNELSQGKPMLEDINALFKDDAQTQSKSKSAFDDKLLKKIQGSEKTIHLERSPLGLSERDEIFDYGPGRQRKFDDSWSELRRSFERQAALDRQRDEIHTLQIKALVQKSPNSTILVLRGAVHQRGIEKFLRDKGVIFTSFRPYEPYVLPMSWEVESKLEVGEKVTLHELLMAVVETREVEMSCDLREAGETDYARVRKQIKTMTEEELEHYLRKDLEQYLKRRSHR
jgi:hypothetical protein